MIIIFVGLFIYFEMGLCSSLARVDCAAQAGPKLTIIFLFQPWKGWNPRHEPPGPASPLYHTDLFVMLTKDSNSHTDT